MIKKGDSNKSPLFTLRKKTGLSRNEAAVLLKVGLTTLVRYETAENDVPCGVAEDMAIIYNVPFDVVRDAIKRTKLIKMEVSSNSNYQDATLAGNTDIQAGEAGGGSHD